MTEAQILALRREQRLGPARIAGVLTLNPSTVHRVLVRHGLPRLAFLDRPTGQPIRRYERAKAERFNRTLAEEWAYRAPFNSSAERAAALLCFLHAYNMHRAHTALGGKPPISRAPVNNLAGHYS